MKEWEDEYIRMLVDFAEKKKLTPQDITEFHIKFLAVSLGDEVDEEDLRDFVAGIYKYLVETRKILGNKK